VTGFDDIALSPWQRGLVALFSDATGSWARVISPGPEREARRLTERCAGGLSALSSESSSWLACSRPAAEPDQVQAGLWLYELDAELDVRSARRLGDVARDGRGVALAAGAGRLFVAWADGQPGQPAVQLASLSLRADGAPAVQRTLSRPGHNGRQPALLWRDSHLFATWSESQLAPGGETHQVMIARDTAPPRALASTRVADPAPHLASDGRALLVSFRNLPSAGARPELYVAQVSEQLALSGAARRLGRANSEGAPVLALCSGTRAALAPLDHAGELYVAFHPLSHELLPSEANHQYYASGREFVLCAASCQGDRLRALLAERTQPTKPGAELLSVEFHCTR
jgi:hypothetical protein